MLLALRQIEIPGAQRIFERQGQPSFPRVTVELGRLIVEGTAQVFEHKRRRGIRWEFFQYPGIQLSDDLECAEHGLTPGLSREGKMDKRGKVFAQTRVPGQEETPIAPFFKALKRAQIDQRAAELARIDLLPQCLLREGALFWPVEEQCRGF